MRHLRIIQQDTSDERVNNSIIEKLTNISKENTLDESSDIQGSLRTEYAYREDVEYLLNRYNNLHIQVTNGYYIKFIDPTVQSLLMGTGIGDGSGITTNDAAENSVGRIFSGNTTITSFNESRYFTKDARTGFSKYAFNGCSNLVSIDLTNYELIGDEIFTNCINLKYYNGASSVDGILNLPNLLSNGLAENRVFQNNKKLRKIESLGECTVIGENCFNGCSLLSEINPNVLNNIQTIKDGAFVDCTNLVIESLSLPIATYVAGFSNTGIKEIENLGTVTSIQGFDKCTQLTKVVLPDSCYNLGGSAFAQCSALLSINLDNITTFNDASLGECSSLAYFHGENSEQGLLNLVNLTSNIPYGCFSRTRVQRISSLGQCTSIGMQAFANCNILTYIDESVLNKIESLGFEAFTNCSSLMISDLKLPNLTSLGVRAFYRTSIQKVSDLGNITRIEQSTFQSCTSLTEVVINSTGSIVIGNSAFEGCTALRNITFSTPVTSFGDRSFYGTAITSIAVPNTVTLIGTDCFTHSSLASITFEENSTLLKIGGGAFNSCPLSSIDIPDSVKEIVSNTFIYCRNLENVTIGTGIETIEYPFYGSRSDFTLTVKAITPPTFTHRDGEATPSVIYVPSESVDAYKAAEGWSIYADRIQAISI